MSILKTIYLQHLNGAAPNATLDANGNMTVTGTVVAGSSMGMRNRIINGDMRIDQRNAGASVTPTDATYTLDRWKFRVSQTSKLAVQQNAGSVTTPAGFANYLGVTSSSAYSVNSTDYFLFVQDIEGFNFSDLDFGTANAKTVTLSFWVRSSLTGTFNVALRNSAANRSYPVTYTILAANTWEQKTITIAGDTSGTWLGATSGIGASVIFNIGCGSTFNGTSGSWQAGNYTGVSGATSVVGTNGATFYITGVQLESGTIATPFEYRDIGTEVRMCLRYHYRTRQYVNTAQMWIAPGAIIATTQARYNISLPTTMRTYPAISVTPAYNTGSGWQINVTGIANFAWNAAPTILDSDNGSPAGAAAASICFMATSSGLSASYVGLGSVPYMPTGVNTNQLILDAEL